MIKLAIQICSSAAAVLWLPTPFPAEKCIANRSISGSYHKLWI